MAVVVVGLMLAAEPLSLCCFLSSSSLSIPESVLLTGSASAAESSTLVQFPFEESLPSSSSSSLTSSNPSQVKGSSSSSLSSLLVSESNFGGDQHKIMNMEMETVPKKNKSIGKAVSPSMVESARVHASDDKKGCCRGFRQASSREGYFSMQVSMREMC